MRRLIGHLVACPVVFSNARNENDQTLPDKATSIPGPLNVQREAFLIQYCLAHVCLYHQASAKRGAYDFISDLAMITPILLSSPPSSPIPIPIPVSSPTVRAVLLAFELVFGGGRRLLHGQLRGGVVVNLVEHFDEVAAAFEVVAHARFTYQ